MKNQEESKERLDKKQLCRDQIMQGFVGSIKEHAFGEIICMFEWGDKLYKSMMFNFIYQHDGVMGCPDTRSNIILEVT